MDGGHSYRVAFSDLKQGREISAPGAILAMDDCRGAPQHQWGTGPSRAWADAQLHGILWAKGMEGGLAWGRLLPTVVHPSTLPLNVKIEMAVKEEFPAEALAKQDLPVDIPKAKRQAPLAPTKRNRGNREPLQGGVHDDKGLSGLESIVAAAAEERNMCFIYLTCVLVAYVV